MFKLVFSLLLFYLSSVAAQSPPITQFRVIRQWKYFNFTWPSEELYLSAIEKREYNPKNIILKRIKYYENNYYLTLPRMKSGCPATLTKIPEGLERGTSPALEPYPSWEMNKEGDCNALQNVQSIEIDDKGHMWIVDLGATSVFEKDSNNKCGPKIVVHDINRNKTINSYTFPATVVGSGSFLYDLVIDDSFAYITDNSADNPGIVVYSLRSNDSWKITHPSSMTADPNAREFRLNGIAISSPINIAPIALGPRLKVNNGRVVLSDDRDVFYSPFSSFHLYSVTTNVLKDKSKEGKFEGIVRDWGVKASQSDNMIMDNQGILYYSLLADNSIGLWDSKTPFNTGQKVIARDSNYIQWISAFAFDNLGNLTVVSSRMQDLVVFGEFNISQNNFWILSAHSGSRSYVYDFNEYHPLPTTSPDYDGTSEDGKLEVNPNVSTTFSPSTTSTTSPRTTTTVTTKNMNYTNSPLNTTTHHVDVESSATRGGFTFILGYTSLVLLYFVVVGNIL